MDGMALFLHFFDLRWIFKKPRRIMEVPEVFEDELVTCGELMAGQATRTYPSRTPSPKNKGLTRHLLWETNG